MYRLFWLVSLMYITISCSPPDRSKVMDKEWLPVYSSLGLTDSTSCFELLDNSHEMVYFANQNRISQRLSPASTFKIFLSLVALETGIAPNENMIIPYDPQHPSWNEKWNTDLNMTEAFKVSSEPYYKEVAKRIGRETLQKFLDSTQYGNMTIGPNVDECWTDGSLLITPDEQVGFVHKLYFDKLPFSARTHRIVRQMMVQEDSLSRTTRPYLLSYKTGTVKVGNNYSCWQIGYIEDSANNSHPYFFANNFLVTDTLSMDSIQSIRLKSTKAILRKQKLM